MEEAGARLSRWAVARVVSRAGGTMATLTMPAPASARRAPRLRLEQVIMVAAVLALIVLVVLPLLFLLVGSVRGERGVSLDHFAEVLSGRLYISARHGRPSTSSP